MKNYKCVVGINWDYIEEDLADEIFEVCSTDVFIHSSEGRTMFEFAGNMPTYKDTLGAIVLLLCKYGIYIDGIDVGVEDLA